jgi:hypothetical protein
MGAGGQIYGGYQANQAAKREANLMEMQGQIAQSEADTEAAAHARDVRQFSRNQALSFLKNGVSLAGSPLLVVDETLTEGQKEATSIAKKGAAERNLYNERAYNTRSEGRAKLIGGVLGGSSSFGSSYAQGKSAGIY